MIPKMDVELERNGGIFSKDFDLMHNKSPVCSMSFDDWKFVQFFIDGKRHIVRATTRGRWHLESGGITIASCRRQGTGRELAFSIDFDTRIWTLKPRIEGMKLVHDIWEGVLVVGQIAKKIEGWKSGIVVVTPELFRMEILSFAVWLIGIHWTGTAGKLTAMRAQVGL